MNKLKELLNQPISLFDENGGVLDEDGDYVKAWWDLDELILISFRGKYLFVKNTGSNHTGKILMKRVKTIEKNEIVLAK